jgi:hypothetical protein
MPHPAINLDAWCLDGLISASPGAAVRTRQGARMHLPTLNSSNCIAPSSHLGAILWLIIKKTDTHTITHTHNHIYTYIITVYMFIIIHAYLFIYLTIRWFMGLWSASKAILICIFQIWDFPAVITSSKHCSGVPSKREEGRALLRFAWLQ